MVSLLLTFSNTPLSVFSKSVDIISSNFLVWFYISAILNVFVTFYMVSPLSRSVSVINCPRVELYSLSNFMVSLLFSSSNSPISVNSEVGFLIQLPSYMDLTVIVYIFIWSLSSAPPVLNFVRWCSLADHCFDFFFPTLSWVSRLNFGGYFSPAAVFTVFLISPHFYFSTVFILTQCL